jgi:hypothetical protein
MNKNLQQVGSLASYFPDTAHVTSLVPFKVNPSSHVKITVEVSPSVTDVKAPFCGAITLSQRTEIIL